MKNTPKDLAGKEYWDSFYSKNKDSSELVFWTPASYADKLIANKLDEAIIRYKPSTVLEIGCGNSFWLLYLNKKFGVKVAGLDYSNQGCELVKKRLSIANIDSKIYCENFFSDNIGIVGKYDFVFSLGVAEHFDNTADTIENLLKYVKNNGYLFTEIPNFNYSIYYFISNFWQPKQLNKHKIFGVKKLKKIYDHCGLTEIKGSYLGLFSFDVIAWGAEPRFPKLEKKLIFRIKKISKKIDQWNISNNFFTSKLPFISPFFFVLGKKTCAE
ncbi:bifunctional 2-polyprenyl-6-hydroxyphenol methylase/3-demethylubiquinol 3-O-methyltransferase UbiG [Rhodonellum sp.]|uniref:class I SAM-dependent methyltransferase n=1 Tax=Rhodonellum sp. TaxID=2231180 RepID=UPI002716463C|nr:class I SAM-dependent methyltransferase [Rhodonellum sp.]MDO9553104.1 class I SAM-dependent methyltransferase [Rhodonellum sp.]